MLTEEQRAFQETARRFAEEQIAPGFMARELQQTISRTLVREMGALGLIGVDLPERFGGLGAPSVTAGVVIEAISYADLNVAYVPLLASLNGQILVRHAPDALARLWVPRDRFWRSNLCAGADGAAGRIGCGKPGTVGPVRGRHSYVLNGEKSSISMADQADIAVVFARTGASGQWGAGRVGVPGADGHTGMSRSRFNDLGSKAVGRGSIFFDGVLVPADSRLAAEGMGFVAGDAGV